MAELQAQFVQFAEAISVRRDTENRILREKRDIVLTKLRENIAKQSNDGAKPPTFREMNQGSYAMGTGIKPINDDYDIDVALRFDLDKNDHEPLDVKRLVYTALKDHTQDVRWRGPCITVYYTRKGESRYHLDLAIYADANTDGKTYLARGKEHASTQNASWEESDPEELVRTIASFTDDADDRAQFRRVVRCLKRWKDHRFPSDGDGAPTGIALTAAALKWFSPSKTVDVVSNKTRYDDLDATYKLVAAMVANFRHVFDTVSNRTIARLSIELPVAPGNDLFERMTAGQMGTLQQRLDQLESALIAAKTDVDPHSAAKLLVKQFGTDFPVPNKRDTGSHVGKAIVSGGSSA